MKHNILLTLLPLIHFVLSAPSICPLIGADFPPLRDVSSNKEIKAAGDKITQEINDALKLGTMIDNKTTSFSINVFSTQSTEPFYQFHYTSSSTKKAKYGTHNIGQDTVYRIGSVSKLFAVYLLLLEGGDQYLNEPITKYLPELAASEDDNASIIDQARWEDITIGALASQLAGIGRDYGYGSIDYQVSHLPSDIQKGFPALSPSEMSKCGNIPHQPQCTKNEYLKLINTVPPVYYPDAAPSYSNAGFILLGFAIEAIAAQNETFAQLVQNKLLNPLGMKSTSVTKPSDDSVGVIPGALVDSGWSQNIGVGAPSGGVYSTAGDLSILGHSILTSSLLSPTLTRRWLKPQTNTASLDFSVGAPWEIYRTPVSTTSTNPTAASRIVDLYTKSGDLGRYAAELILSPDYNIGIAVLVAGGSGGSPIGPAIDLSFLAADILLPAFEAAGHAQAASDFAGHYEAAGALNSSLTLAVDAQPGMKITSWISNGTDFLATVARINGGGGQARLYPTVASGGESVFRAVYNGDEVTNVCFPWGSLDTLVYGGYGLDEFVFQVNGDGEAVSVEPKALRVKLGKGSG